MDEALPALLLRLRNESGLSRSRLSRASVSYDNEGVSEETIKALEAGKWHATARTLEAIAHGLGVPTESFPQYRLAKARALLDERVVGLDGALENLSRIERSLLAAARQTASEVERQASSAQQRREAARAPATRKAAARRGRA